MNDYRLFHDAFQASLSYNGDYLMHSGRKGMRWGRSIFQDDYVPMGKPAKGDNGDGNDESWVDRAYNGVRTAASNIANGARNVGNEAARQAHHARGYASVAADKVRTGAQQLADDAGHQAERWGRRANYAYRSTRNHINDFVDDAKRDLNRAAQNVKNDALIGYANHLARKYDEPYTVERQGHTYRSQYTGDQRRISREDFNSGRRRPRKAYKRRTLTSW